MKEIDLIWEWKSSDVPLRNSWDQTKPKEVHFFPKRITFLFHFIIFNFSWFLPFSGSLQRLRVREFWLLWQSVWDTGAKLFCNILTRLKYKAYDLCLVLLFLGSYLFFCLSFFYFYIACIFVCKEAKISASCDWYFLDFITLRRIFSTGLLSHSGHNIQ